MTLVWKCDSLRRTDRVRARAGWRAAVLRRQVAPKRGPRDAERQRSACRSALAREKNTTTSSALPTKRPSDARAPSVITISVPRSKRSVVLATHHQPGPPRVHAMSAAAISRPTTGSHSGDSDTSQIAYSQLIAAQRRVIDQQPFVLARLLPDPRPGRVRTVDVELEPEVERMKRWPWPRWRLVVVGDLEVAHPPKSAADEPLELARGTLAPAAVAHPGMALDHIPRLAHASAFRSPPRAAYPQQRDDCGTALGRRCDLPNGCILRVSWWTG